MSDAKVIDQSVPVNIASTVEEGVVEDASRYTFQLTSEGGVTRTFIIDVPHIESGSTDVWVADSIVAVGDTPEDGFATFSVADTTDEAYRQHHDGIPAESFVAAHHDELIEAGFTVPGTD